MHTIAALFVDPAGVYSGIPGVDCWGADRDARLYAGPFPVVAHPPCQLWGRFARVNFARWGGEHNRPGNDGGCFMSALASVRRFGGVLEHPAFTDAWVVHDIPRPDAGAWQQTIDGGYVCEVWQSAYGHLANKATWLYYCGETPPEPMLWERPIGSHQIGQRDQRGEEHKKPTLSGKAASATPRDFALALVSLAVHAGAHYQPTQGGDGVGYSNNNQPSPSGSL